MPKKLDPKFYLVEEGIPIPTTIPYRPVGTKNVYPFAEMRVDDSFLAPGSTSSTSLRNSATAFGKRIGGWKFVVRRWHDGNWRCWRVE